MIGFLNFMIGQQRHNMSKARRISIILGSAAALMLCAYLAYAVGMIALTVAVMEYDSIQRNTHWREYTTPLEHDVVTNICKQFDLPENDPRCHPDAVVYAPDFFRTISQALQPANHAWATYEEVEAGLGAYKYDQVPVTTLVDGT